MLKVSRQPTVADHLLGKQRQIVITNVCNLNCGGCNQLIGNFAKDQLWFIPLEELEQSIGLLERYPATKPENHPITIFGGEPTLHPKWKEIVAMLKRHAPTVFWINTNGRLGHQRYQKEDNLVFWVDLHPESQLFVQTLYAAQDAIDLPTDMAYWEKAQKDCPLWNGCQSSIYNGKVYFCENAGPMDHLFYDGKYGWKIDPNKHPFDHTKEEIDEQAKNFCKRCGWCVTELVPRQLSRNPSNISPSNAEGIKGRHALPVVQEPTKTLMWDRHEGSYLVPPPSVGVYRLGKNVSPQVTEKIQEPSWAGIVQYTVDSVDKHKVLEEVKHNQEWTILLDANQVIPNAAYTAILNWMLLEKTKDNPRSHMSIPVYNIPVDQYDPDMKEPGGRATSVIVAFHRTSKEVYDDGIYERLGHRKIDEGNGRTALWHDKATDIVGGVVTLT
jgi:hypothetical protein